MDKINATNMQNAQSIYVLPDKHYEGANDYQNDVILFNLGSLWRFYKRWRTRRARIIQKHKK